MKHELAVLLQENSDGDLELHEGYSGRGMYGNQTTGLTGSYSGLVKAVARTANELSMDEDNDESQDLLDELMYDFDFSTDSMGFDTIFY